MLETVNPTTERLYTLDDLTIFSMEEEGTGMLEDGIFARAEWLAEPRNREIVVRFLRASFRGWIFCRENPEACVRTTLAAGPSLGAGHQRWMMNEVNALIWPAPDGIGLMERAAFDRTAEITARFGVIAGSPDPGAYRSDLTEQALAGIAEDTHGTGWQKPTVDVTPGGR